MNIIHTEGESNTSKARQKYTAQAIGPARGHY